MLPTLNKVTRLIKLLLLSQKKINKKKHNNNVCVLKQSGKDCSVGIPPVYRLNMVDCRYDSHISLGKTQENSERIYLSFSCVTSTWINWSRFTSSSTWDIFYHVDRNNVRHYLFHELWLLCDNVVPTRSFLWLPIVMSTVADIFWSEIECLPSFLSLI